MFDMSSFLSDLQSNVIGQPVFLHINVVDCTGEAAHRLWTSSREQSFLQAVSSQSFVVQPLSNQCLWR